METSMSVALGLAKGTSDLTRKQVSLALSLVLSAEFVKPLPIGTYNVLVGPDIRAEVEIDRSKSKLIVLSIVAGDEGDDLP